LGAELHGHEGVEAFRIRLDARRDLPLVPGLIVGRISGDDDADAMRPSYLGKLGDAARALVFLRCRHMNQDVGPGRGPPMG
jgi:hypothetical protein